MGLSERLASNEFTDQQYTAISHSVGLYSLQSAVPLVSILSEFYGAQTRKETSP